LSHSISQVNARALAAVIRVDVRPYTWRRR